MGVPVAAEAQIREAIQRVLRGSQFKNSETLPKLLLYLLEQTLLHPDRPLKEHQIATQALNRPLEFDPRLDAIVRVQTGRLRTRLLEYYAAEGVLDPLVIELPKGSYHLHFSTRGALTGERDLPAPEPEPHKAEPPVRSHPPLGRVPAAPLHVPSTPFWKDRRVQTLSGVVLLLVVVCGVLLWERSRAVPADQTVPVSPAVRLFWQMFTEAPDSPMIVYSNAEFVGRPETGMRYRQPGETPPNGVLDHYSGVGEVNGVFELVRLFNQMHRPIRVKRSRLLAIDDAKAMNIVFIGSPSENLVLRELLIPQDFEFDRVPSTSEPPALAIINRAPRPGEFTQLLGSPTLPIAEDYAMVSVLPGLIQNRWVMLLAGTTTLGTQAAAEFVCRPQSVQELLTLAKITTAPVQLEAVLKVEIRGGVPVRTRIVAVHSRK